MAIGKDNQSSQPLPFFKRSLKSASLTWIVEDFRRRREKQGQAIVSEAFGGEDEDDHVKRHHEINEKENSNNNNNVRIITSNGLKTHPSKLNASSPSSSKRTEFKVYFYPNGIEDADQTALFVQVSHTTSDIVKGRFAVSILDKNGDAKIKKVFSGVIKGRKDQESGIKVGWNKFYPRRKLLDAISQILRNGTVTLVIDVFFLDQDVIDEHINAIFALSPLFQPKSKSGSDDFKQLYETKNFDICVKTRDNKSIPTHRIVLFTSHVIEKLLIRDRRTFFMLDDYDSSVIIPAIHFMYHREFDATTFNSIDFRKLLRFSDQYKVPALKFACEQELYNRVTIENIVSMYECASDCNANLLLHALEFMIVENVDAVTRTSGWWDALVKNHQLITHFVQFLGQQLSKRS